MKQVILLLCLFGLFSEFAFSQYVGVYEPDEGSCNFFIRDKNWPEAISCYSTLVKEDSTNKEVLFYYGKAHIYARSNKPKGLKILEQLQLEKFEEPSLKADLAMGYFYTNEFDKAKKIFSSLPPTEINENTKRTNAEMLKQCDLSKKLIARPVNVSFENLGKNVNSNAPDFLPVTNKDESLLTFTTKRNGVVGNIGSSDGYKTADIYVVKHKRNKYSRARSIGSPNTLGNEYTAGSSENDQYLLYRVNNDDYFDDIFISELGRRSYMAPSVIKNDDLKKTSEVGAAISEDGQTIYFSSDREGGFGGYDIWLMRKLPTNGWSEPINLGKTINTAKDEQYPSLINNGNVLIFSSNGHPGMGGMDLFKSILKETSSEWSLPTNLGYPINTTEDELNISFSKNKRYAYMAQNLDDSFGDLDIYRLTFQEEKDNYTLFSGRVMNADSTIIKSEVMVEIFSEEDGSLFGTYKTNPKNGKYNAILPSGRFMLEVIDVVGYEDFTKSIQILGKNDMQEITNGDIFLKPK